MRITVESTDNCWKVVVDPDGVPDGELLEILVGFAERDEWMRGWERGETLWDEGYLLRRRAEGRGSWAHEFRIDPRYRPIVLDKFYRNVEPFEGSRAHRLVLEHIDDRQSPKSLRTLPVETALVTNAIQTLRSHNVLRKTPNGQLTIADRSAAEIVAETGRLEGELNGDPSKFEPCDYLGADLSEKEFVETNGGWYEITAPSVLEAYAALP